MTTHTILFNIATSTVLGLTSEQRQQILDEINCIMNGDNLYEGASQEIILEAYFNQHSTGLGETWVDLIDDLMLTLAH
jgi:hypothetical protein